MQKLRSLEMLRAIAALLVVLYHTQTIFAAQTGTVPFRGVFEAGFRGVDLFFVLSGFIIGHVHATDVGSPWRLGNYIFNRAARIYPAVWIMTLLAGAVYAAGFGGVEKTGKLAIWSVVASALLLPQAGMALVNVTWTLKCEIFFYLVFAVVILDLRIGLALLGAWQFSVLAVSFWFQPEALGLGEFYLRSLCLDFGVGLGCAWLIRRPDFVAAMRSATLQHGLLLTGIVAFVAGIAADAHTRFAGALCGIGAGPIIVGLMLLERSGRIRIPTALVRLGGASYSIYLVHYSVITLLATILMHFRAIPMNNRVFLAVAVLGIAVGFAFDQLIDKPIQLLIRHKLKPLLLDNQTQLPSKGLDTV